MITFEKFFDIAVCGAGIAGVAAAVKCARLGAKICLIEKTVIPGGLATSGFINIYLPLCDGKGRQIIRGIAEELLHLSIKYGPQSPPSGWGNTQGIKNKRYMTDFSPGAFVLALDELLENNDIDVWYDTIITGVDKTVDGHLNAVYVLNTSGHGIIRAKAFIDATGDAQVAYFAGCELTEGINFLSLWALQASMSKASQAVKQGNLSLLTDIVRLGADDKGIGHPEDAPTWRGINGKKLSEYVIRSRRLLREHYQNINGKNRYSYTFPLALPSMAQFRKTRMIKGSESVYELKGESPDLSKEDDIVPDWRTPGRLWRIPCGALSPIGVKGLFVAGRIISSLNDDAWDAVRVIPVAAFTGEKAGKMAYDYINKIQ